MTGVFSERAAGNPHGVRAPCLGSGAGRSLTRLSSLRRLQCWSDQGQCFCLCPSRPAGSPQGRVVLEKAFCLAVPSRSPEKRSSLASSAMGSDRTTAVRNLNWTINSPPPGCCLNKALWLPNIIHLPEEPGLLSQLPFSSRREHEGWTEADPGAGLTACDVSLRRRKGSGWSSRVMATKQTSCSWWQTSVLTSFRKGLSSWMRLFRLKAIGVKHNPFILNYFFLWIVLAKQWPWISEHPLLLKVLTRNESFTQAQGTGRYFLPCKSSSQDY